jgi:hypothetical protein
MASAETLANLSATPLDLGDPGTVLLAIECTSPNAAETWITLYALPADEVEVGVTPPAFRTRLAANESRMVRLPRGVHFPRGLSIAATTTAGGDTSPVTPITVSAILS